MEHYRIVMYVRGKWRTGKIAYTSIQEANERRQYFISNGMAPRNIKVVADSQIFN